jgi:hypothetical protein
MLSISVDIFNGSQALFSFNSASSLLSIFVQIAILVSVFYLSVVIFDRIRFFLLGYFADKKYFDVVSQFVFSSFNRFLGSAIVNVLILLVLKRLNVPFPSDTAVLIHFGILIFIVLTFFLTYAFNVLIAFLFKVPAFDMNFDALSVFSLKIRETEDGKYVLYLNGSKVRRFEAEEELTDFLRKIKDYLGNLYDGLIEDLKNLKEE